MRFGTGSAFTFYSEYWTNDELVDENDESATKNADGKFPAFLSTVASEIKGCLPSGCKTYTLETPSTLKDLFTDTPIGSSSNLQFSEDANAVMEWSTIANNPSGVQITWKKAGINFDDDLSSYKASVRFGALFNNEGSIVTANDAIGFGASEAGGGSVGAGAAVYSNNLYPMQGTIWVKAAPPPPWFDPATDGCTMEEVQAFGWTVSANAVACDGYGGLAMWWGGGYHWTARCTMRAACTCKRLRRLGPCWRTSTGSFAT